MNPTVNPVRAITRWNNVHLPCSKCATSLSLEIHACELTGFGQLDECVTDHAASLFLDPVFVDLSLGAFGFGLSKSKNRFIAGQCEFTAGALVGFHLCLSFNDHGFCWATTPS